MNHETPKKETVRCPTCRAEQEWSDACRRCRSDLRLLRACHERIAELSLACFVALREFRSGDALAHARELTAIDPSAEAWRLLAVSALAAGDFASAANAARMALGEPEPPEVRQSAEKRNEFRFTAPVTAPVSTERVPTA